MPLSQVPIFPIPFSIGTEWYGMGNALNFNFPKIYQLELKKGKKTAFNDPACDVRANSDI